MVFDFISEFLSYETKKRVQIKNIYIGVLRRIFQLVILLYIIVYCFYIKRYVLVYKRGYQKQVSGTSINVIKVKGAIEAKNKSKIFI